MESPEEIDYPGILHYHWTMKIRKDLVKYKAHNVALYWKLEPRAFVEHCLMKSRKHELDSLEDIDAIGKQWYLRKQRLLKSESENVGNE